MSINAVYVLGLGDKIRVTMETPETQEEHGNPTHGVEAGFKPLNPEGVYLTTKPLCSLTLKNKIENVFILQRLHGFIPHSNQ